MNPRWLRVLKEYVEALAVALVLALFIRGFVVQAFKIPSGSMLDTLQIGDHLLVKKFAYGIKIPVLDKVVYPMDDPKRGDIIVFEFPEDTSKDFIKRIIGTPGDVVEMKNKDVYVNGEKLVEPYTRYVDSSPSPRRDNLPPTKVPEGQYFCLGDNRDESYDSRFWGFVDRAKIKGKAWIIYWSWDNFPTVRFARIGQEVK